MKKQKQVGRLALRREGGLWAAYFAENDTMDGAIFLGSIAIGAVTDNPERKKVFTDLMRDIVTDVFTDQIGETPEWGGVTGAPEHERGGQG